MIFFAISGVLKAGKAIEEMTIIVINFNEMILCIGNTAPTALVVTIFVINGF